MSVTTTPARPVARRVPAAATVASASAAAFLVLLAALHVIKPELDPSWRMVSEYEIGAHGWIMSTAFLLLTVSCASLGLAVRRDVRTRGGRVGLALLALAAVGTAVGGVFTSDPITATQAELTTHGNLHGLGAALGIPGFVAASVLLDRSLRRNPAWHAARTQLRWVTRLVWGSLLVFAASVAVLYDGRFGPDVRIGWQNRLLVVAFCIWLLTAAHHARRIGRQDR